MIFTQLIQTNLKSKELGKKIEYYHRLESTNTESWELIKENQNHGTIVITDNQINGKGRNKHSWEMIPGKSLTFSTIIEKDYPSDLSGLLSLASGIAVIESLIKRGVNAKLKWPNDIFFDKKKLGGILSETKMANTKINKIVIGVGINVNEDINEYSNDMQKKAISMFNITGHPHQRELIVAEFINSLEIQLNYLIKKPKKIINSWHKHCGNLDKKITFHEKGKLIEGIFIGLNKYGFAKIKINNKVNTYNSINLF